jgi:hypothetical protein
VITAYKSLAAACESDDAKRLGRENLLVLTVPRDGDVLHFALDRGEYLDTLRRSFPRIAGDVSQPAPLEALGWQADLTAGKAFALVADSVIARLVHEANQRRN